MTREDAISIARTAALNCQQRAAYPYLPIGEAQAANWMPPGWVIEAIMQASAPTEFKFEDDHETLNAQFKDYTEGLGASEDVEDIQRALRRAGLTEENVSIVMARVVNCATMPLGDDPALDDPS